MMQVDELAVQHSHSSVKASAAGVDEASDHSVEDEGQDLRKRSNTINGSERLFILYLFPCSQAAIMCVCSRVCVFSCVCVFATCRGRLSMRQQHPKAINSTLVRMKALMALVTFWILRSLLGTVLCLMGRRHRGVLTLMVRWDTPIITTPYNIHVYMSHLVT